MNGKRLWSPCLSVRALYRYVPQLWKMAMASSKNSVKGWGTWTVPEDCGRVAVGRALLACPELLLMDEPLTGLDRGKREEIMAYVKAIPERFGVPVLYVTHSDAERRFLADRVLNLEDGKLTDY